MVKDAWGTSLESARMLKKPWPDVAREVQRLEQAGESRGATETPLRYAERVSGYSTNQLRRMMAGADFLDELSNVDPETAAWLGDTPRYSHVDMLEKLWRKDKAATLEFLRSRPVLRYDALYERFHSLEGAAKPPVTAGQMAGLQFQELWIDCLNAAPEKFRPFGPGEYSIIQPPRNHHAYCKPALLLRAQLSGDGERWAGLDFIETSRWSQSLWRKIMLVAVEATFLDAHFLFVREGSATSSVDDTHKRVTDMLTQLQHGNAKAFAFAGREMPYIDNLADQLKPPVPDRRAAWRPPRNGRTVWTPAEELSDWRP